MSRWRLYEFQTDRGQSVIREWLIEKSISERDRGQLVMKMDLLARHGSGLPPKLLAGPIRSKRNPRMQSHIYKLIIHGDKMLRPMLCKGPIDLNAEFTMLLGAIEINFQLDADAEDAEMNRQTIIRDNSRRILNGRYA